MERSRVLTSVLTALASFALYLPVIAGILTPMVWLLAAWYFAWDLLSVILPYSSLMSGLWLVNLNGTTLIIIWLVEIIVIITGAMIFLAALREMVTHRSKGGGLITTGPYSYIRHPQHLGIALFLLPFSLFQITSLTSFAGIRPGDIVSWLFVVFLLLISADYEEFRLLRLFDNEFIAYRERTAFIIPRIRLGFPIGTTHLSQGRPLRYILLFLTFWVLASLIMFVFSFVELQWIL